MQNLAFSAVCDILKNKDSKADSKLIEAADFLLDAILILGPTLIGMPQEKIKYALTLIGTKNEIVKLWNTVLKHLKKRNDNSTDRQERMAAAFCSSAYAAFFEALSKITPEVTNIVDLSQTDKWKLVHSGLEAVSGDSSCSAEGLPATFDPFGLPHPAETLDQLTTRLLPVYEQLTKGVFRLLEAYEAWDTLKEEDRKAIAAKCSQLPRLSGERFRAQYFDLATKFSEFAIWSNLREHAATQQQIEQLSRSAQRYYSDLTDKDAAIDLGLKELKHKIEALPKSIDDYHVQVVWKDLDKQYTKAIQHPIIKDPVPQEPGKPALRYPSRSEIFIPQAFKVIRYSHGTHLESEDTWKAPAVRKDLGEYLLSYLQSPYSSFAPLIILGQPGSGKSLLSQMIAAQTMSNAFAPIRIELRGINADNEIEAQIEEQIRKDIARSISFSSLMDSLEARPAVIIFDGYDELLQATGQVFAGYVTKVQKFQEREAALERNAVRSIVTSRITLIDKAVIPEGSTILRLLDFEEDQQSKWISVWNKTNAAYFETTGIKPFASPSSPKLAPIAKQPLLLLMLALYDSTSNQVNSATALDQTVLYNNLLKRFIERERAKDEEFKDLKPARQRDEIDREMQRLGIAAVGMFNRHALHIRATQLNADLDFFSLTRNIPSRLGRQLTQSELLLGSFFFVHQSTAQQGGDGNEREVDAAFEFLHNTFGEFLTGHFLVSELLRHTNTLFKLRGDAELVPQRVKTLSDPDGFPPTWYSSLMHAALFSRPVIFSMITEWVEHALKSANRKLQDVLIDFDDILFSELQRVVSGREFSSIMVSKQTSFDPLPLLGYLANYTLNLITMRLGIADEDFIFDERRFGISDRRPRVWDRLAHLWKSWFSPDALNALNSIFTAERENDRVRLRR